ncbi:MAG TPA: transcriptional regulator [Gammaproteobacteria bacterium]|nr:transcriptional regulator [Gammaproteobacteria bacterium]
MKPKVISVGIISRDNYARRTVAIAQGSYKPRSDEPKLWFESLRSMAEALSPDNQELLRLIVEKSPQSLAELEQISGRKKSNLSRTLKMLEGYGIVSISRKRHRLIPKVHATDFKVEFGVNLGRFPKKDKRPIVTG